MGKDKLPDPYADREQVRYMNELHGKVMAAEHRYDRLRRKYALLVMTFIKAVGVEHYRKLIKEAERETLAGRAALVKGEG
jgi:hypothetical protein